MAMAIGLGCEIPELQDDNYKIWKERILLHLGWLDIDYAIREDEPLPPDVASSVNQIKLYEQWERSNRLCVMFIKTKIPTSIRGSVEMINKVKDLLKELDDQFAIPEKAMASSLIRQFSSMRLTGVTGVCKHIMQIRNIATQLKSLEIELSETFLVYYILSTLPPHYDLFKSCYYKLEEKWSIDELTTMCIGEESRLQMNYKDKVMIHSAVQKKAKKRYIAKNKQNPSTSIWPQKKIKKTKWTGHEKK